MHQISPAPCTGSPTRGAISPSLRQAALLAHLDGFAYLEDDLDAVVHEACRVAADGIGAGFAWVLQYRANRDAFVLQAGVGWPAQMIGRIRIAAELGTTAGLAWLTGRLVQFSQLDAPDCIWMPESMTEHGVHRMVSVPFWGDSRRAFGVLEVGSREAGEFTRHDLSFVQELASRLCTAADRQRPARIGYQQDAQGETG